MYFLFNNFDENILKCSIEKEIHIQGRSIVWLTISLGKFYFLWKEMRSQLIYCQAHTNLTMFLSKFKSTDIFNFKSTDILSKTHKFLRTFYKKRWDTWFLKSKRCIIQWNSKLYNFKLNSWNGKSCVIRCNPFGKCWALDISWNLVCWNCCGQKLDWSAKVSVSKRCAVLKRFTFFRKEKKSRFVPFIFCSYFRLRDQFSDSFFPQIRVISENLEIWAKILEENQQKFCSWQREKKMIWIHCARSNSDWKV